MSESPESKGSPGLSKSVMRRVTAQKGASATYDEMVAMLREVYAHFSSEYHCCKANKRTGDKHDEDCILGRLSLLLRSLP